MSQHNNYDDEEDDFEDLDDVLDDFDDEILSQAPGATLQQTQQATSSPKIDTASATGSDANGKESTNLKPKSTGGDEEGLGSLDVNQELEKNFQDLLKEMASEDPELQNQLSGFLGELNSGSSQASSQNGKKNVNPDTASISSETAAGKSKDFKNVISETMSRLKTNGDKIDKEIEEEQPDELISQLLQSLNLGDLQMGENGEGIGGIDDIGKLLVDMLDQLSSKEVLYDPLNDLYTKYPEWLNNNVSNPDIQNYTSQYKLIDEIMTKFNDPKYTDSNKEDKSYISDKLEKLQELGMPPKEIMNDDLGALPAFGGAGLGGSGGLGDGSDLQLNPEDIPEDLSKELEESCKQT